MEQEGQTLFVRSRFSILQSLQSAYMASNFFLQLNVVPHYTCRIHMDPFCPNGKIPGVCVRIKRTCRSGIDGAYACRDASLAGGPASPVKPHLEFSCCTRLIEQYSP